MKKLVKNGLLHHELIPTPLLEPAERIPLEIVETQDPHFFVALSSLRSVLRFLFLLLRLFTRRLDSTERALRLRQYIERQGGVWIKAAQLFATRTDILPQVYCDELGRLTDSANAFPPEVARGTIEASLGGPLAEFFDEFDPIPLAAASIGQVHRARLKREQLRVAVKVKRPHIASAFARDLAIVRRITSFLHRYGISPHMRWDDMYDELETMLLEELDYRIEASIGIRLRRIVIKHGVYAPKVFLRYCTSDILVMELVDGVLMSEYLKVLGANSARAADWCYANKIVPRRVAFRLFETLQRQILEEELFHADLHPGNIMLLKNSRFALLDFGSAGRLEGNLRELWMRQAAWYGQGNYVKTTEMSLQIVGTLPPMDVETYTRKMARLQRNRDFRASARTIPYQEKFSPSLTRKINQLNRYYKIPVPWDFMRLMRTFFVIETSIMHLDPRADLAKFMVRYRRRAQDRAQDEGYGFSWIGKLRAILNDLPLITQIVSENVYFNAVVLRRNARSMQTRVQHLTRTTLAFLGTAMGALVLLVLSAFIHQICNDIGTGDCRSQGIMADVHSLFMSTKYIDYIIWVIIILLAFNAYRKLKMLKRLYSK